MIMAIALGITDNTTAQARTMGPAGPTTASPKRRANSGALIAAEGVGYERDLAYIAGFIVVLLLGPGRPSLDHILGLEESVPRLAAGPTAAADPQGMRALVATMVGFWVDRARRPAPPGLPTIRRWQAHCARGALRWLDDVCGGREAVLALHGDALRDDGRDLPEAPNRQAQSRLAAVAELLDAGGVRCLIVPAVQRLARPGGWWPPRRLHPGPPRLPERGATPGRPGSGGF